MSNEDHSPNPPPKKYLTEHKRFRLAEFRQKIRSAVEAEDADGVNAVSGDDEYSKLLFDEALDKVREIPSFQNAPASIRLTLAFAVDLQERMQDVVTAGRLERKALERRIAALEARPALQYRGVWQENTDYNVGDFVTENGSVWACRESTRTRPGASVAWQLAVKKGRDRNKPMPEHG